jgi:hypothetical protein
VRPLIALALLLSAPAAHANLNFIGMRIPMHGAKSTIQIQGEGSCSYHRQSPATLTLGGGQAQPLMLPGSYGHGTAVPTPSSLADTNTVYGAYVTVPLSRDTSKNCDEFYDLQRSRARLKLATELHAAGQITDEQYAGVAKDVSKHLR